MARTVQITFDTADPYAQASWWAELLGYAATEPAQFEPGPQKRRFDNSLHHYAT